MTAPNLELDGPKLKLNDVDFDDPADAFVLDEVLGVKGGTAVPGVRGVPKALVDGVLRSAEMGL